MAVLAIFVSPVAAQINSHSCCPEGGVLGSVMEMQSSVVVHQHDHQDNFSTSIPADQNCDTANCTAAATTQYLPSGLSQHTDDVSAAQAFSMAGETASSVANALNTPPPRFD